MLTPIFLSSMGKGFIQSALPLVAAMMCGTLLVAHAAGQDLRHVTEPSIPQVCASLHARISSENGRLPDERGLQPDTARIQDAIDHCIAGRAVELRPDGSHTFFLSGPLELKPSVTLLVASGAILFASRDPRTYDVQPGSCGIVNEDGRGCKPFIHAAHAPHSGVMGAGAIDGQGGEKLLGQDVSWWDLAQQAKGQDKRQNCPRLIVADASDDFTLYGITLRNSANFHVIVSKTDGFTAWAVKIDSPANSRNTDGIDPASSSNVTIAYSYIHAGDDNVAIKAGKAGPASHITIAHNHFYTGHGMSIGSETNGSVSAVRVSDLTIDGADNGIRIKSDVSRGGLVRDIAYERVCMRNVKNPIVMDPFYSRSPGNLPPTFEDIVLRDVRDLTPGEVTLEGLDAQHLLKMHLDGVVIDGLKDEQIRAQHARFEIGPNGINFRPQSEDVQITGVDKKTQPRSCQDAFVAFPSGPVSPLRVSSDRPVWSDPIAPQVGNQYEVLVAADGSGDYTTVQQGVDALVGTGGTVRIKPGTYREVVRVAKPHIRLLGVGDDSSRVVIVFGNSAYSSGSTFKSATVFVTADDFYARNLTVQNDFSKNHELPVQGGQALALSVTGDRAIFSKVRFLGAQDTLFAASRECQSENGPCVPTRQYFEDCYIEGHIDFIFGDSKAVFERCEIHAIEHPTVMLTAQSKRYPEEHSGYVFDHCRVTSDSGVGKIFLGRPWRDYASVVFMNTELSAKVDRAGWSEWKTGETHRLETAFYAEYKSSGPGANPDNRETYARQLTDSEAGRFSPTNFLAGDDGWNPTEAH